ncbi:hypothetical protein [Mycetocola saprophilus]|uniref:hypothetical protein n=1 Tax=Mycetocola saprophilus TaxID=76636 RepID=UPI0012DCFB20|nr:hypothetical protein [Mycetocola saprophilus]
MAWFKVDDKLHASRKVMKIPRRHRLAALGLWTIAGSWCADQETDGVVPDYMIEEWGGTTLLVNQLVTVGLWLQLEDSTEFHNWEEYQPTKEQLDVARKKNAEKLRNWRERNRDVTTDVTELQDGSKPDSNPAPDPTRPNPTRPLKNSLPEGRESPAKRGTRLSEDWVPTSESVQKMREDAPDVDTRAEHAAFVDYWIAQPGQKGVKLNWEATWRNWMRRKQGDVKRASRRPVAKADQNAAEYDRLYGGGDGRAGSVPALDAGVGA